MPRKAKVDLVPLLYGPYVPPDVTSGWLEDVRYGLVKVGGWTEAPIRWPKTTRRFYVSPILCGSLLEAVRRESSKAIQQHWGVSQPTVWKWRQTLGIGRATEGTLQLIWEARNDPQRGKRGKGTQGSVDRDN